MSPRSAAVLLAAAAIIAPVGCRESPRQRAEAQLSRADLARVRREAAVAYKDLFASSGTEIVPLPITKCPASFRQFQPERIVAHRDGFALAISTTAASESGLYILPAGMEHVPSGTRRARFERLRDGIFWYVFE